MRQRRCAEPPSNSANLHYVGHRESSGVLLKRPGHFGETEPVLSHLNRSFENSPDAGMTREILLESWFFDPFESFLVQAASAPNRLRSSQALVVVHHDPDLSRRFRADGANDSKIFIQRGVANLRLHGSETSLGGSRRALRRQRRAIHAVAVISAQRS